jgi:hypothetical protein
VRAIEQGEAAMTFSELLLAAALLSGTAPAELSEQSSLREQFPTLRLALTSLALEWEILDPRETRYVLAREEDLYNDLRMLQRRYQELADAPWLSDASRFPDRAVINELLAFNRAYRNYVESRQPMETVQGSQLRVVQREIEYLYQVWDTVRDARCDYYYVTVRRQALKKLRELIGEEAYYRGELPPHVPLWRFQEID